MLTQLCSKPQILISSETYSADANPAGHIVFPDNGMESNTKKEKAGVEMVNEVF